MDPRGETRPIRGSKVISRRINEMVPFYLCMSLRQWWWFGDANVEITILYNCSEALVFQDVERQCLTDNASRRRRSGIKNKEMVPIFYAHLSPYDCKLVTRICLHHSLRSSWADVSVLLDSWISSYGLTVHDADTTINGIWTLTTSTFLFSFV